MVWGRREWKVHFSVTQVWHRPISRSPPPSLGRPFGYSEIYQMWQLRSNKVEVFNKCSFSWICTGDEWKIVSPHLEAIPFHGLPCRLMFYHSRRSKLAVEGLSQNWLPRDCHCSTEKTALCKRNYAASVIQAGEYNSDVYLNPEHISRSNEVALEWDGSCLWFRLWGITDCESIPAGLCGECGGEIKERRHCLSLDPDAALLCWGIAHLQCRNQPHPLSSHPHRAHKMRRESKRFPSISRLHSGCFLALPLRPSSAASPLWKLFLFTNICWQRGIPNLSRAFFQISLLRLNADLSNCRCCRVLYIYINSSLYLNGFKRI